VKFLLLLFLLAGCADHDQDAMLISANQDLSDQIIRLQNNCNPYPTPAYHCPYIKEACVENKALAGCKAFKNHLIMDNIKLSESSWSFCERYESK
jgi:hypothetical protein